MNSSNGRARLPKVISEISDYGDRTHKELKNGIKKQAKELFWFFSLFVVYVMFGAFVFLYIEECSDAAMADDSTVPSLYDTKKYVPSKNITATCWQLYLESQKQLLNATNQTVMALNTTSIQYQVWLNQFEYFLPACKKIIETSTEPFIVKGRERLCLVTEFQILKYAEFCIFSLLTVGYGNETPVTIIGRYMLILYAICGVPIAVTMYSVAGKLLVQTFTMVIRLAEKGLFKREPNARTMRYKVLGMSLLAMMFIILIGCGVTTREDMENLSFHSSVYFWFVSLTTIGYGDIHFDRQKHLESIHFLMLSAANLLFGLGIVAAIIESFALALEKRELGADDDDYEEEKQEALSKRLKRLNKRTGLLTNSLLLGGLALDLGQEVQKQRISQALMNGGFVFEDESMKVKIAELMDERKMSADAQRKRVNSRALETLPSLSEDNESSYFQLN